MRNALLTLCLASTLAAPAMGDTVFMDTPQTVTSDQQPALSSSDHWAWVLIVVLAVGLFLPAALLGPLLRRKDAELLPELHTAQEANPHAASQHEPGHTVH